MTRFSRLVGLLSSVSLSSSLLFCRSDTRDWSEVKEWVRSEFPDVPQTSVDALFEELASAPEGRKPLLLDVREEEEFAVSHLQGAIRVAPGADPDSIAALDGISRDAPIVAYCSVGYRSSRLVAALRARGFTNASNLEGSIFEWANRGLPVKRNGAEVDEVHPFDEEWGRYLKPELRTEAK